MILLLIPLAVVAVLLGVNLGWRWVLAPLLAGGLLWLLLGSLRTLVTDVRAVEARESGSQPIPVSPEDRTLFWCEECGTEVLLLVRGSARAPSHCGSRMHERTEIPS